MIVDPEARVTTAEAAALCGVDPVTIRSWQARGHLPRQQSGTYRLGDVAAAEQRAQVGRKRSRSKAHALACALALVAP